MKKNSAYIFAVALALAVSGCGKVEKEDKSAAVNNILAEESEAGYSWSPADDGATVSVVIDKIDRPLKYEPTEEELLPVFEKIVEQYNALHDRDAEKYFDSFGYYRLLPTRDKTSRYCDTGSVRSIVYSDVVNSCLEDYSCIKNPDHSLNDRISNGEISDEEYFAMLDNAVEGMTPEWLSSETGLNTLYARDEAAPIAKYLGFEATHPDLTGNIQFKADLSFCEKTDEGLFVEFSDLEVYTDTEHWRYNFGGEGFSIGEGCGVIVDEIGLEPDNIGPWDGSTVQGGYSGNAGSQYDNIDYSAMNINFVMNNSLEYTPTDEEIMPLAVQAVKQYNSVISRRSQDYLDTLNLMGLVKDRDKEELLKAIRSPEETKEITVENDEYLGNEEGDPNEPEYVTSIYTCFRSTWAQVVWDCCYDLFLMDNFMGEYVVFDDESEDIPVMEWLDDTTVRYRSDSTDPDILKAMEYADFITPEYLDSLVQDDGGVIETQFLYGQYFFDSNICGYDYGYGDGNEEETELGSSSDWLLTENSDMTVHIIGCEMRDDGLYVKFFLEGVPAPVSFGVSAWSRNGETGVCVGSNEIYYTPYLEEKNYFDGHDAYAFAFY